MFYAPFPFLVNLKEFQAKFLPTLSSWELCVEFFSRAMNLLNVEKDCNMTKFGTSNNSISVKGNMLYI